MRQSGSCAVAFFDIDTDPDSASGTSANSCLYRVSSSASLSPSPSPSPSPNPSPPLGFNTCVDILGWCGADMRRAASRNCMPADVTFAIRRESSTTVSSFMLNSRATPGSRTNADTGCTALHFTQTGSPKTLPTPGVFITVSCSRQCTHCVKDGKD